MSKKKSKEFDWEAGWRCDDCNGWNETNKGSCIAPQHEYAVRAIDAERRARQLVIDSIQDLTKDYVTASKFVDDLAGMMKEFLVRTYGKEPSHPRDLTAAAASFMDAYFIISEHRDL